MYLLLCVLIWALVTFQSVKFLRAWILVEATAWGENLYPLAGVGTITYLPLGDSTKCMVSVALLGLGGTADTVKLVLAALMFGVN